MDRKEKEEGKRRHGQPHAGKGDLHPIEREQPSGQHPRLVTPPLTPSPPAKGNGDDTEQHADAWNNPIQGAADQPKDDSHPVRENRRAVKLLAGDERSLEHPLSAAERVDPLIEMRKAKLGESVSPKARPNEDRSQDKNHLGLWG